MNKGICVSISAVSSDDLSAAIERAEQFADVIEIRADHLRDPKGLTDRIHFAKPLIITYRPEKEGGRAESGIESRLKFWRSVTPSENVWVDNEFDLREDLVWPAEVTVIRSYHDLQGNSGAEEAYSQVPADEIAKIAVTVNDAADAIPIWKLLERANAEGRRIIPIAMGEAGKWTRILGLSRGALLTYANLESGKETAAGQIAAAALAELYRVRELDAQTAIYGLIAGDTSYSLSPILHNSAFGSIRMNAVFVPFQVRDLAAFVRRMVRSETREVELNFGGFAVTNPHKTAIIPFLDHIDETGEKIGAVNTIKIIDGKLHGSNTDADGFIGPLRERFGDLKGASAAVIGAGGAARACVYALIRDSADVTVFARDTSKADLAENVRIREFIGDRTDLRGFDIIVNTTPVGTKGASEHETVVTANQFGRARLAYDLIYDPTETRFISEAKKAGVETLGGLEMLIEQGRRQFELWTGSAAPVQVMAEAARTHLNL